MVKEYKGVNIYVNPQGEFYCDVVKNSDQFKNKTFSSYKLPSLEKAIDEYSGKELATGEYYYEINIYNGDIKKLTVISKVGNRIFFDDGSDTSMYTRKQLYPSSIEESKGYISIIEFARKIAENQEEINRLNKINEGYRSNISLIISSTTRVSVI